LGRIIIVKQWISPPESTTGTPGPVEPVDVEARTFADIENGEPDSAFDEIILDAAII
jgi:hypothetical protein